MEVAHKSLFLMIFKIVPWLVRIVGADVHAVVSLIGVTRSGGRRSRTGLSYTNEV